MKNLYDKSYFENGIETGVSCYVNYRWMPDQTYSMCKSIIDFAEIKPVDRVLDYGCAKGFIVRALVDMGYDCIGVDISEYAISQAHDSIKDRLTLLNEDNQKSWNNTAKFNVAICKDVLEHVPYEMILSVLTDLRSATNKLFVVVPLAENGVYVATEYEIDITHIIREDLDWWKNMLVSAGFKNIDAKYLVNGIKDNWSHYSRGNGFFLCS